MAQIVERIPKALVRGVASGVFFMAVFGTLWAYIGIVGLSGWGSPWLWPLPAIVGGALFLSGLSLTRAANQLTDPISAEDAQNWQKRRRFFRLIFATEGISMGIVTSICFSLKRYDLVFPLMALIVGLHFFPLAPLFRLPTHYATGALLCLLSLITIFAVPAHTTLGGQQIIAWWLVVGAGSMLILWLTGLIILFYGRSLLWRGLHQHEQGAKTRSSLA